MRRVSSVILTALILISQMVLAQAGSTTSKSSGGAQNGASTTTGNAATPGGSQNQGGGTTPASSGGAAPSLQAEAMALPYDAAESAIRNLIGRMDTNLPQDSAKLKHRRFFLVNAPFGPSDVANLDELLRQLDDAYNRVTGSALASVQAGGDLNIKYSTRIDSFAKKYNLQGKMGAAGSTSLAGLGIDATNAGLITDAINGILSTIQQTKTTTSISGASVTIDPGTLSSMVTTELGATHQVMDFSQFLMFSPSRYNNCTLVSLYTKTYNAYNTMNNFLVSFDQAEAALDAAVASNFTASSSPKLADVQADRIAEFKDIDAQKNNLESITAQVSTILSSLTAVATGNGSPTSPSQNGGKNTTAGAQAGTPNQAQQQGQPITINVQSSGQAASTPTTPTTTTGGSSTPTPTAPLNSLAKYALISYIRDQLQAYIDESTPKIVTNIYLVSSSAYYSNATQTTVTRFALENYSVLSAVDRIHLEVSDINSPFKAFSGDAKIYAEQDYYHSRVLEDAEDGDGNQPHVKQPRYLIVAP